MYINIYEYERDADEDAVSRGTHSRNDAATGVDEVYIYREREI